MQGRKNDGIRKSFEKIMKELGHDNRTIDILKVLFVVATFFVH
jgi:hypothetical protein